MFPRDENVNLCGVDTKIVTHSGRRSQLILSAMRCGHPSSYIGSSVDRASQLQKLRFMRLILASYCDINYFEILQLLYPNCPRATEARSQCDDVHMILELVAVLR